MEGILTNIKNKNRKTNLLNFTNYYTQNQSFNEKKT